MKKLSDFEKNVLLIVCMLAIGVIAVVTGLDWFGVISDETAWRIDLAAVAWWFGAIMTFTYERKDKLKENVMDLWRRG